MATPGASDHFQRLLGVLLPAGGRVMIMLEGYFDESGDLGADAGIFCVSGYFLTVDAAKQMDAEWKAVLEFHKIPYFHMVDCAHGAGVFKDMLVEERIEIVKKLIGLIKKYTLEGFATVASTNTYQAAHGNKDAYTEFASGCVTALHLLLRTSRAEGDIAYFFESGHKSKGSAYNHIARSVKRPTDSLTFAAKEQVRLLQAADLLAWQVVKYAKDWLYPRLQGEPPKRQPRKDFESLMEHSHSFMHVRIRDGRPSMDLELWPLSKRSPHSVNMSIDDTGPIVFLREEGNDMPIVPVEKTMGWKMGGARLAHIAFTGMVDRPFALLFDEPRLFEAIIALIGATKIHEHSNIAPLFSADDIVVDRRGDVTVLRIKVREGASIAFHVSSEVLDRLKEKLSSS